MQRAPSRAVLFDYDDTLVETRRCKYQAIAALAERHYGVEMPSARIDAHWAGLAFVGVHGRTTEAAAFERAGARSVASLAALLAEVA